MTLNMEGMLSIIEVLHVCGELPLDLMQEGGVSKCSSAGLEHVSYLFIVFGLNVASLSELSSFTR